MPPFVNGWTSRPGQQYVPEAPDLDKAKALMADAGYGDGFSVTLELPERSLHQ